MGSGDKYTSGIRQQRFSDICPDCPCQSGRYRIVEHQRIEHVASVRYSWDTGFDDTMNVKLFILLFLLPFLGTAQFPSGSVAPSSGSGGSGTVTSVTFTGDGTLLSSTPSSPVTTAGTLTGSLLSAAQNTIWGGPPTGGTGAPSYQTSPTFNGTNILGVITTNGAQFNYEPIFTGNGTGINGVTWVPSTNVNIVTTAIRTNFVNGQIYSNNTGSEIVLFGSTTNGTGGVIAAGNNTYTMSVSNIGYASWSNTPTGGNVVATSIAGMVSSNNFSVCVDPGGVYMGSSTATGTGNVSGLIPGTGQIVTIGNATASGVPSLGGNNTFTGNNAFTGTVSLGVNGFSASISNVTEQTFSLGNASNYVSQIAFTNLFAAATGMILSNQLSATLFGGAGTNGHIAIYYLPSGQAINGTVGYEFQGAGVLVVTNNGSNIGVATNIWPTGGWTNGPPIGWAAYANSTGISIYQTNSSTTSTKEVTLESLKPMTAQ